jgi:superfamily II DNA or RNA helicase
MPRGKTSTPTPPPIPADPRLLETDLRLWAGGRSFRGGRRDALLGRVEWLRLIPEGSGLDARVRDHRPVPHTVTVRFRAGELYSECTCPEGAASACKHAVAAIQTLRFPLREAPKPAEGRTRRNPRRAQPVPAPALAGFVVLGGGERTRTRAERVAEARAEEVGACRQRSLRKRFTVELISGDHEPPTFSVVSRSGQRHVVCLRGPKAERPNCCCQDFAENELGTCEHIERVQRWYLRKPKRIPHDLLSVWFSPRTWTDRMPQRLEEIRLDSPLAQTPPELERWFGGDGYLRSVPQATPPEAWLEAALEGARCAASRAGWTYDEDSIVRGADSFDPVGSTRAGADAEALDAAWADVIPRLGMTLHPYQELGARFLARRGRAFLADDMGLGKTVQSIAAALLLRRAHGAAKVLVVCPASLKHQWAREIEKVCDETSQVIDGPRAARLQAYQAWSSGFLILNYELVLRDLEAIRMTAPDLVILDEAQRIKNQGTKTARAVKQLDSRWAFVLTGTPLENRLVELHSLVEFLHRRALGPRWRLRPFHVVEDAQGRVLAYEGLEVLRRRLRGFFLRRDRREVLDQLPDRTDNTFWTGMTTQQRRPYNRQAIRVATLVRQGRALNGVEIQKLLRALTRMRMLCNARAQDAWESWEARVADPLPPDAEERRAIGSPKLEEFAQVIEELLDESEEKIVVFSQWKRMLHLAEFVLRSALAKRDIRCGLFHGGLKSQARVTLLDGFRIDPDFRVLLSTDAGGLGLNLQDAASIVVHLEVPWNPAVLEQRVGRVHRMGQQHSVRVLHFVTRGAIEEKVRQVVENKRALFDGLLTDGVDQVVFDEEARASLVSRLSGVIDDERAT